MDLALLQAHVQGREGWEKHPIPALQFKFKKHGILSRSDGY